MLTSPGAPATSSQPSAYRSNPRTRLPAHSRPPRRWAAPDPPVRQTDNRHLAGAKRTTGARRGAGGHQMPASAPTDNRHLAVPAFRPARCPAGALKAA